MIILGVDPGWGRCGWSKIKASSGQPELLEAGLITTSKFSSKPQRLKELHQKISFLIKKTPRPDVVALEEVHLPPKGLRISNLLGLGEARGVLMLAASQNNIEIQSLHPLWVKSVVTGNARSNKLVVARFLKSLVGGDSFHKSDDTADAVAIAYTAAMTLKVKKATCTAI